MGFDKRLASGVEHRKHFLKTIVVVVGVGHIGRPVGVARCHHHRNLGAVCVAASEAEHIAMVLSVHDKNMVELLKIAGLELPAPLACDVNPMPSGSDHRARIGRVADVPKAGAGAVHRPRESALSGFVLHNTLCKRASADVAETNHEYAHL